MPKHLVQIVILSTAIAGIGSVSAADTAKELKTSPVIWGGFIDTYYAWDANRPRSIDRSYTTQAARHNEFNVNLAFVEAKVNREKTHARLALQAGTSVQNNYSSEPVVGTVSGPTLSRHIQEAYVGYHLNDSTWVDAGIMFSHIGLEGFISRDNLTYTRSLVADYSPYYQSGVRLSHAFNDQWSGQLLVVNGWQNISESNPGKGVGSQISFTPTQRFSVTYNTLFSREASFRQFHDLILKWSPSKVWTFAGQFDWGLQEQANGYKNAMWTGCTVIVRAEVTAQTGVVARVERYFDPKQVIVSTGTAAGFRTYSASLGLNQKLDEGFVFRMEGRGYSARDTIFQSNRGAQLLDAVAVASLALSF